MTTFPYSALFSSGSPISVEGLFFSIDRPNLSISSVCSSTVNLFISSTTFSTIGITSLIFRFNSGISEIT
ncbi:MAG: hypothetical protein NZ942_04170, partial [Candidatus Aenigmarchaeota archaeon]|nr:hypothetical protein [Candidatus Aenigmarchaeota archaeon]